MADLREDLKRALQALEGPLRFVRKGDQALASLKGLEQIARRAVGEAKRLALSDGELRALARLEAHASAFEAQNLEQRRRSVEGIVAEIRTLVEAVPVAAPVAGVAKTPAIQPKTEIPAAKAEPVQGRPRIRSLSAEGSLAPVAVEGEALSRPLSSLKGIGPAVALKLAGRGLHTLGDALLYLPRSYEDRRAIQGIRDTRDGQHALVQGRIVQFGERLGRRKSWELLIEDDTGGLSLRWFGYKPGQFRAFTPGAPVVASGEVRVGYTGRKEMMHPDLELGDSWDDPASFGRIIPVYTEIEGVSARWYRRIAQKVVEACAHEVTDFLPERFRAAHGLLALPQALAFVHFPPQEAELAQLLKFSTPPQRRLVFDELFFVQLGLALKKRGVQVERGIPLHVDGPIVDRALGRLPFKMTGAQRRAFDEILKDVAKPTPMNRLLQGDVGSGKTAVALASALVAVENGLQAAVMAPTELLAEQHARTFERLLGEDLFTGKKEPGKEPIRTALVAAGRKPKDLMRARNEVASGTARIAIGTHALFSESVEFKQLGLVVIDEQHRFGVLQRAKLMEKGLRPHVLVMTATPIPRTLALTLYGDLDVSIIDELPPGRTPVTTRLYSSKTRGKAYDLIRSEVSKGRQAYVVLPLVEESEKLDLRAATEEAERLAKEELAGLSIGLVHGRMTPEERGGAMERFRRGETQVLVATTVIEVGVDVPNASVMLIEHSERFGLSQLHQLRGRVGRGAAKSYCLLAYDEGTATKVARERLGVMTETNDGFRIAEADLEIRGPGEFLGTKQSGMPDLVVADLLRDQAILKEAREAAFQLIERDPDLRHPGVATIKAELERRWAGKMSLARIG